MSLEAKLADAIVNVINVTPELALAGIEPARRWDSPEKVKGFPRITVTAERGGNELVYRMGIYSCSVEIKVEAKAKNVEGKLTADAIKGICANTFLGNPFAHEVVSDGNIHAFAVDAAGGSEKTENGLRVCELKLTVTAFRK